MRVPGHSIFMALTLLVAVAACGESSAPVESGYGANPVLPEPNSSLIPTVNIAPAKPWGENAKPVAASGFSVNSFAAGLSHPRWVYVLPNGDVLVAETDAPAKPDDSKGIKGMIMKRTMKKAGSGEPSANRITLLRDADGDGVAETRSVFIEGLNSPFGMTLIGHDLYVADTDAVMKFNYEDGATKIAGAGTKLADLPAGAINHHWTKNIIASEDGLRLYVTVGSNSNAAENGIDAETNRAEIMELDPANGHSRVYASGLRNPNGMSWNPQTHALWVVVNERDELGNNLVPDYMTSVQENGFYGWPYSYYGQHTDSRVKPMRDDLVAKAIKPDYALGAHTASLGLTFYHGSLFPARYSGGAFVGQHGSWNRKPRSGYKVIFVPFADGRPSGAPEDVLTGFLSEDGTAYGRPVGVTVDSKGALLVADDVGDHVWRITPATSTPAP
jgi:glucose/arabinose dehydrogenase